jgi:hypothetical protein
MRPAHSGTAVPGKQQGLSYRADVDFASRARNGRCCHKAHLAHDVLPTGPIRGAQFRAPSQKSALARSGECAACGVGEGGGGGRRALGRCCA